jgi:hypothetical protein
MGRLAAVGCLLASPGKESDLPTGGLPSGTFPTCFIHSDGLPSRDNMKSIRDRQLNARTATNAKPSSRKSVLFWWLLVAGIFLMGKIGERTAKYAPETLSTSETTLVVTH